MNDLLRVAVVGGGITGLAAAYHLKQQAVASARQVRVVLLEATDQLGGKIQTEHLDGFLLEKGPDSLLARKVHGQRIWSELGLKDQLVGSNPDARGTFVLHRGRLEPLPESMVLVAPTRLKPFATTRILSPWGKLRAAADLFLPARPGEEDESLADFVTRRFGHEVADRLAIPLLASIYGGGGGDLSVLATFPELRSLERSHRSVLRGLRARGRPRGGTGTGSPFITLRPGLHDLVDRLARTLSPTEIVYRAAARRLTLVGEGTGSRTYRLELANGDQLVVDALILATPADVTSRLLAEIAPRAAEVLASISYTPALIVNVAFARDQIAHSLRGTGFLVPNEEKRSLIACTWVSRKWPHASEPDKMLFRCYVGGPRIAEWLARDDSDLIAMATAELTPLLGITGEARFGRVYRWPTAIPQYAPGHLDRIRAIEQALEAVPEIVLAGAAFRGVGVPDCLRQGEEAAETLLARADTMKTADLAGRMQ